MIEKLTEEQEALIPVIADKWYKVFTDAKIYPEKMIDQIKWLYKFSDLPEPKITLVDSPLAAQIEANLLQGDIKTRDVSAERLKFYNFSNFGNISDYGWVALYDYFSTIENLDNPDFNQFKELLLSGVYDMIQFDEACIAIFLPLYAKKDNKNNMHCETGPAIEFRDGYKQWFWKGTNVPQHWIEDSNSITTKESEEASKNIEKRRVLIDVLGVTEYYKRMGTTGLTKIDSDFDNKGHLMTLYGFEFEKSKIQVLECICPSSGRVYNIYPPNQKSSNVYLAKASTFGITEQECRSLVNES